MSHAHDDILLTQMEHRRRKVGVQCPLRHRRVPPPPIGYVISIIYVILYWWSLDMRCPLVCVVCWVRRQGRRHSKTAKVLQEHNWLFWDLSHLENTRMSTFYFFFQHCPLWTSRKCLRVALPVLAFSVLCCFGSNKHMSYSSPLEGAISPLLTTCTESDASAFYKVWA